MNEHERARNELEVYANTAGQPNQPVPHGHALVRPATGIAERVIGAQPVAVHRDEARILQKLTALAAAAGTDWFYRFPVRSKDGSQSWIEGPSIKLANDVARIFGNDVIEIREIDVGDAWVFYSRFTDIETGFSMERAYRQRKSQTSLKTKDTERQLDIAYQSGQSKSIRNIICNALQIYADFAFDAARNSLVEKIGKDLEGWRQRTIEGIGKMPVALPRVERVIGRAAKDWLAPQIAQIIAMMRSVADGMATTDETFPPDVTVAAPAAPAAAASPSAAASGESEAAAAGVSAFSPAPPSSAPEPPVKPPYSVAPGDEQVVVRTAPAGPKNTDEYLDLVAGVCAESADPARLLSWFVSDQQRKVRNGAGMVAEDTKRARKLIDGRCSELERDK